MDFATRLAQLLAENNMTANQLAQELGCSRTSINKWLNGGSIGSDYLQKLADRFHVSCDYLLGLPEQSEDDLSIKEKQDISRKVQRLMGELDEGGDLMFDGNPMTAEAQESLRSALALGFELARRKNKEKYTPKKYRK